MHVIIDIDAISDASKKEWLLNTLRIMDIRFDTADRRQTFEKYNLETAEAEAEIKRGEFVTAADLKKEALSW